MANAYNGRTVLPVMNATADAESGTDIAVSMLKLPSSRDDGQTYRQTD